MEVQSTLVFANGSDAVTPDAAEQRLRKSLDQNGFIMGLQLDSIQGETRLQAGEGPGMEPGESLRGSISVALSWLRLGATWDCDGLGACSRQS